MLGRRSVPRSSDRRTDGVWPRFPSELDRSPIIGCFRYDFVNWRMWRQDARSIDGAGSWDRSAVAGGPDHLALHGRSKRTAAHHPGLVLVGWRLRSHLDLLRAGDAQDPRLAAEHRDRARARNPSRG